MSWQDAGIDKVEGIRKVKWDGLWHVMYEYELTSKQTYDRVDKRTAMRVLKMMEKRT
jgi:hypothetical protein